MSRIPFLISLLLLVGCASAPLDRTELMPAPAVFEAGGIDPFADVLPEGRRLESEILFATDRDPATAGDLDRHYASRRGYLLRLGRAEIQHGDSGTYSSGWIRGTAPPIHGRNSRRTSPRPHLHRCWMKSMIDPLSVSSRTEK